MASTIITCDGKDLSLFNPTVYKLQFPKISDTEYYCQIINTPSVDLGVTTEATRWLDIPDVGEKITFGDVTLRILLDKKCLSYKELFNWLKKLSVMGANEETYSDFNIVLNEYSTLYFTDAFPISISGISLDSTLSSSTPVTFFAIFKYKNYNIK